MQLAKRPLGCAMSLGQLLPQRPQSLPEAQPADLSPGRLALADAPRFAGSSNRRRALAVGVAFILHCGLLLAYFGASAGAMVSGGAGDDGEAVTVSLASLAGGRAPANPEAQLAQLYRKVLAEHADLSATTQPQTPRQNLQNLMDELESQAGQGGHNGQNSTGEGTGSQARSAQNDNASRQQRGSHANAPAADGPGATASSGGIWGEVEPCWNSLPDVSRVSVTLQITLDDKGRVAKPPQIVRPFGAQPDEPRLISEARALTAIAACVPYHSPDFLTGQRKFTVQFAASAAGAR